MRMLLPVLALFVATAAVAQPSSQQPFFNVNLPEDLLTAAGLFDRDGEPWPR